MGELKWIITLDTNRGETHYITDISVETNKMEFKPSICNAHVFDSMDDVSKFYEGLNMQNFSNVMGIVSMYDYQITREALLEQ